MAIRKIVSRSIGVDVIAAEDLANNSVTAAEIQDGVIGLNKLSATGTKDATTFLRGDNSFQVVTTPTLSSLGIDNHDDITVDANGNIGVNNTDPDAYTTSGKVVSIKGTANNTGPSVVRMESASNGAGYMEHQVFGVTGISAETEITRLTGTGANGFCMMIEVTATGHTGSASNGLEYQKLWWEGNTEPVRLIERQTTYGGWPGGNNYGKAPVFTFDTISSNVVIINLTSGDGTGNFNGVVEIKYRIPIDFASNTWTTS